MRTTDEGGIRIKARVLTCTGAHAASDDQRTALLIEHRRAMMLGSWRCKITLVFCVQRVHTRGRSRKTRSFRQMEDTKKLKRGRRSSPHAHNSGASSPKFAHHARCGQEFPIRSISHLSSARATYRETHDSYPTAADAYRGPKLSPQMPQRRRNTASCLDPAYPRIK